MAKSSLDFIDRLNVKVLTGNPVLTKDDCGRVFVLNSTQGHQIVLPSVDTAGPGWHARFVVGTVQTDLTQRLFSSIAAPGTEGLSLPHRNAADVAGAVTNTGVAAIDPVLELDALPLNGHSFTIVIPAAAGGSGTTFTFTFRTNDGAFAAASAGNFQIALDLGGTAVNTAAQIITDMINGVDPSDFGDTGAEGADYVLPPAGSEGSSTQRGLQGARAGSATRCVAASRTSNSQVTLTMQVPGVAAPTAIVLSQPVGQDAVIDGLDGLQASAATPGVNQTAFVHDGTRTIQIHPSGTAVGDIVEVELVNGAYVASSRSAS